MKWNEAREKANDYTWAFLELMPQGKVTSREQYDYVVDYANAMGLNGYIKPFEEAKDKYINLGNFFGGARYYIVFGDKPDGVIGTEIYQKVSNGGKTFSRILGYEKYHTEFTYGKLGKIDLCEEQ